MGRIIQFKQKEPGAPEQTYMVWTCSCGGTAFFLLDDGSIICPACEEVQCFRYFDPEERNNG